MSFLFDKYDDTSPKNEEDSTPLICEATEYDCQVCEAQSLLDQQNFRAARLEVEKVIEDLEPHVATLAEAARLRGKAILFNAHKKMVEGNELPSWVDLGKAWNSFQFSLRLEPDNTEAKGELANLAKLYKEINRLPAPPPELDVDVDVVVVGAGAAGVGVTLMLTHTFGLHPERVMMVERGANAGSSFRAWPEEMRFISPSFNQQGWTKSFDLNSIRHGTSPAYSLLSEHPSGTEYAAYLQAMCQNYKLFLRRYTSVLSVKRITESKGGLFEVEMQGCDPKDLLKPNQTIRTKYVIWAAGEFQYPRRYDNPDPCPQSDTVGGNSETKLRPGEEEDSEEKKTEIGDLSSKGQHDQIDETLVGAELCVHNSQVTSWAELEGNDDFVVIGGYESGIDAAVNLAKAGKGCSVLAGKRCWRIKSADPSVELAPFTAERLRHVMSKDFSPRPRLYAPIRVVSVKRNDAENGGGYSVTAVWKEETREDKAPLRTAMNSVESEPVGTVGSQVVLNTSHPPILCTGFDGSVASDVGKKLFAFATAADKKKRGCLDGAPLLTKQDESTKVPGVFLVGPTVSHGSLSLCFIYKFRQRFAIVANAICKGLGVDTRAAVAECRKNDMYLDDFSCCGDTCGDVC